MNRIMLMFSIFHDLITERYYIRILMTIGPSAHFEDQWVGYEDLESVYAKGKYIKRNGYGGATMWTVDLDDFQNRCCLESYPLLKSINRALGTS